MVCCRESRAWDVLRIEAVWMEYAIRNEAPVATIASRIATEGRGAELAVRIGQKHGEKKTTSSRPPANPRRWGDNHLIRGGCFFNAR